MHIWKGGGGGLWLWVLSLSLFPDSAQRVINPAQQGSDGLQQEHPHEPKSYPKERTAVGVGQEKQHHRQEAHEVPHLIQHPIDPLALSLLACWLQRLCGLCVHTVWYLIVKQLNCSYQKYRTFMP